MAGLAGSHSAGSFLSVTPVSEHEVARRRSRPWGWGSSSGPSLQDLIGMGSRGPRFCPRASEQGTGRLLFGFEGVTKSWLSTPHGPSSVTLPWGL